MVFEKFRDYRGLTKTQYDDKNEYFKCESGKLIKHETLQFRRPIINILGDDDFEVVTYNTKTYVSKMRRNVFRVSTCDSVTFTLPDYEIRTVIYDDMSHEAAKNVSAVKTPDIINDFAVVFYNIETGGFSYKDDILQVSMKCGAREFNCYIDPTQPASEEATKVNGLTARPDIYPHALPYDLLLHGEVVRSLPAELAFIKLLNFLKSMNKKCILVAHNNFCFDMPRFLRAIKNLQLLDEFEKVIQGFADTLVLFKSNYPGRSNGYSMTTLANDLLGYSSVNAHDAEFDVKLLEKVAKAKLSLNQVVASHKSLGDCLNDKQEE